MSILDKILMREKKPDVKASGGHAHRKVLSWYDAGKTNNSTKKHWLGADALSADNAASPTIRRRIAHRARYEFANNSYCFGMCTTIANDTVGISPRLEMLTDDENFNREFENVFSKWFQSANIAEKIRTARLSRLVDGESFVMIGNNPGIRDKVKLDIALIECDRVQGDFGILSPDDIDGIKLDQYGNPKSYRVLKSHPGDSMPSTEAYNIDAEYMIHYYTSTRPGQHRGISELTPALDRFGMMRDYSTACLESAQSAACYAGVLTTDTPAGEAEEIEALESFELSRNMLLTLPQGWDMKQNTPAHPVANYQEFIDALISEIARCLNIPWNIAAGKSKDYNFASGRLDTQTYYRLIDIERNRIKHLFLDNLLQKYIAEYVLVYGVPRGIDLTRLNYKWYFDGFEPNDPVKTANAQKTRLELGITTLADETARDGKHWADVMEQRAKEAAYQMELNKLYGIQEPDENVTQN